MKKFSGRSSFVWLILATVLTHCKRNDAVAPSTAGATEVIDKIRLSFPDKLSDTHLFAEGKPDRPNAAMRRFDVRVSLWSDGAAKERYLLLPANQKISYDSESGQMRFPVGTTVAKNFYTPTEPPVPIETRVMHLGEDGVWKFVTYVYGDDGLAIANTRPRKVTKGDLEYRIPSEKECQACHQSDQVNVRGLVPEQLGIENDGVSQIDSLSVLFADGVVEQLKAAESLPRPTDESVSVEHRTRSYMAVNCGTCHNPQGGEKANLLDMRWKSEDTHLVSEGKLVPGDLAGSKLWLRLSADQDRMPPLAQRPDDLALSLFKNYIETYPAQK